MELADLVVVNKADGDLLPAAAAGGRRPAQRRAPAAAQAAGLGGRRCCSASAVEGTGIAEVWARLTGGAEHLRADGALDGARADQAVAWMWSEVREGLLDAFLADATIQAELAASEQAIRAGERSPTTAAQSLLSRFEPGGG